MDYDEIPMFTVFIIEMQHEGTGTMYHWHFKDAANWYDCTRMPVFSMTPAQAKPFLPHLSIWKYPGVVPATK